MKRRTKTSDPPVDGMVTRVAGFGKAVTAKGEKGGVARESNRVSHKMRGGYWLLNKSKPPNRCLKHRWWNHTGRKANSENGYAIRTKRQVLGRRGGGYSAGAVSNSERGLRGESTMRHITHLAPWPEGR